MITEQVNAEQQHDAVGPTGTPTTTLSRRRAVRYVAILLASALVFCGLIVIRRDTRARETAMSEANEIRNWLQAEFDSRSFLPAHLPADRGHPLTPNDTIPYPSLEEIRGLRRLPGPYFLWCGPRQGLIAPGADGAAGIEFRDGELHLRWLSIGEVLQARERRSQLLTAHFPAG